MVKQLPRRSQIVGVAWAPPYTLRTRLQMPRAASLQISINDIIDGDGGGCFCYC